MKRTLFVLALLLVLLVLPAAGASAAANAPCDVSPTHGPPGTIFSFSCSGFSPNTIVNVWAVDPSGVAQSGTFAPGAPDNVKTNNQGVANFLWVSAAHATGQSFASELGDWLWTVNQLCLKADPCIVGRARVRIDSVSEVHAGASLTITPDRGTLVNFKGDGTTFAARGFNFEPFESVSVWVTQPNLCDTDDSYFSTSAADYGDFKADANGQIAFDFIRQSDRCIGKYSLTARGNVSGRSAEASLIINGNPVAMAYSAPTITVSPNPVSAVLSGMQFAFVVTGSGFGANESVSCWTQRPDSRTEDTFDGKTDGSGNFSATAFGDDIDASWPAWSALPGKWSITCRGNKSLITQFGYFMVQAPVFDP